MTLPTAAAITADRTMVAVKMAGHIKAGRLSVKARADLTKADLTKADLTKADLTKADLQRNANSQPVTQCC